jgi:hypothetical protein
MMFLLRMAFWIMLVCLLLPESRDDSRKLISSAGKAFDDMRSFCSRNPDVCQDAKGAATSVLAKMKNGVELAQGWMAQAQAENADATQPQAEKPASLQAEPAPSREATPITLQAATKWDSSLKSEDRVHPWRGPK